MENQTNSIRTIEEVGIGPGAGESHDIGAVDRQEENSDDLVDEQTTDIPQDSNSQDNNETVGQLAIASTTPLATKMILPLRQYPFRHCNVFNTNTVHVLLSPMKVGGCLKCQISLLLLTLLRSVSL